MSAGGVQMVYVFDGPEMRVIVEAWDQLRGMIDASYADQASELDQQILDAIASAAQIETDTDDDGDG
jgi:hypothetical protein